MSKKLFSKETATGPAATIAAIAREDLAAVWRAIKEDPELSVTAKAGGWTEKKLMDVVTLKTRYRGRSWYYPSSNAITINYCNHRAGLKHYHEYRSFRRRPDIGSLQFIAPGRDCNHPLLSTILVHELSHLVQHQMTAGTSFRNGEKTVNWPKPHGHTFKNVYSYLRRAVINHRPQVSPFFD